MLDTTTSAVLYKGGDGQSVFPIPFPFLETAHIRAWIRLPGGAKKPLAPGIDYAVNKISDANGELVLLADAPTAEEELGICRLVPLTQDIFFHNQGPNSPGAIEEAADKLTMIAQQLQADIDTRLSAPDGESPEEISRLIADATGEIAKLGNSVADVRNQLGDKAALRHTHSPRDVDGLDAALADKAAREHEHEMSTVTGLAEALSSKLDADDPRLDGIAAPGDHAATHARGGGDPLTPQAIGALTPPPDDGKAYLAASDGWIEYVPTTGGGEGGGGALPSGGSRGDILAHSGIGGEWKTTADVAAALPVMSETLKGVARIASGGGVELDAGGALRLAPDNLLSKENIESRLAALSTLPPRIDAADAAISGMRTLLEEVGNLATLADTRLDALGALALAADVPADGLSYVRRHGAWTELPSSGGAATGGGALAGEIRLLPFRVAELPSGWYFCNGDRYANTSPVGQALLALPATMRSDWGIAESGGQVNVPNLFKSGAGCFLRPVNGSARQPGSVQTDAIRNITGSYSTHTDIGISLITNSHGYVSITTGAFNKPSTPTLRYGFSRYSYGDNSTGPLLFDASRAVPVAEENRPVNVGMTPAIYLGA